MISVRTGPIALSLISVRSAGGWLAVNKKEQLTQRRVDSWWAQWTCVGGTCAPAAAPPRNQLEHALDVYTSITAPFLRGCCVFATVAAAWAASTLLGSVSGLLLEAAFFVVAGTYCLANFSRCREAHCIVTGIGWSTLAVASIVALVAGRDIREDAWIAFLIIALAGHGFEAIWKTVHGSNALRLGRA